MDEDPAYASQFGSHLDGDEYVQFQNAADDEYEEYEDVEEIARYDALNNDKDETLYRDDPLYRKGYDNAVPDAPTPPKYDKALRKTLFGSEEPDDGETGPRGSYDY